jgi:hypothetical protein
MLRILPLADDLILPQAKQEIYFFNRIGRLLPVEETRSQRKTTLAAVLAPSGLLPMRFVLLSMEVGQNVLG